MRLLHENVGDWPWHYHTNRRDKKIQQNHDQVIIWAAYKNDKQFKMFVENMVQIFKKLGCLIVINWHLSVYVFGGVVSYLHSKCHPMTYACIRFEKNII